MAYDEIEFLNKLNQKEIEILTNLHKYKSSNIKDTFSFYAKQGKTIDREGKVFVEFFPRENKVKITGEAVVVFKTKLLI
ncbi:TPA: hypothetical protein R1715_000584 [Campylobacter lari]|nr:hypothetical protein [Campylobacter lari]EAK9999157.1 hypothetical protein [Campylobacter lari]MCR2084431.1 hypothetical protein [Campylobacter lari subsp. concheus]HEC1754266.1 hypothetical protein [Campylobacter lari]